MNFIVKTIGKKFRHNNSHEVNSRSNVQIYMQLIPFDNYRLDLGKDYILCGDEYYDKERRSENRDEKFLNSKIISEVSISIFNYEMFDDEEKKDYENNCGYLIHSESFVGLTLILRNDVFNEIQNNIIMNKSFTNFSFDFKEHNKNDEVSYGPSFDGSHVVWKKENNEQNRLDIDEYHISFSLYELTESLTWQERQDEENRKQVTLMNTIEQAVRPIYGLLNDRQLDPVTQLFKLLKPYLIIIVILLTVTTLAVVF